MQTRRYRRRSRIEAPADFVFAWHARPAAFERLTPPWSPVRVVDRQGTIENGARISMLARVGGFWRRWNAVHRDYIPGRQFCDVQETGPFAHWVHTHRVLPDGEVACFLEDDIEYALPFGPLGALASGYARRTLERLFRYRQEVTRNDLLAHWTHRQAPPMKIAITGSSGLVGKKLSAFLAAGGHEVVRVVRGAPTPGSKEISWDPANGKIDAASLEGVDAVIHLAGENIASRWSAEMKAKILDSRVQGTRLVSQAMAGLTKKPQALLCASAIGYYGDRGDELLDETSKPGDNFLAGVCRQWEEATRPAADAGIRVVNLRFGVILSPEGGALAKMLLPFRLGLGGRVGDGRQYWSWVAIDDVIGAAHHALMTDALSGPVNVVAPRTTTNLEFTKALGHVLRRPTIFPMPAFAARLALGEMANELLLASARVTPQRLTETGYLFRYPELEPALRRLLGTS